MIQRIPIQFTATPSKVVLLYLDLSERRTNELIQKIAELTDSECDKIWMETKGLFEKRHRDFTQRINQHVDLVEEKLGQEVKFFGTRKNLLGAYVSKEYSTQAAALFNPSIVLHPVQNDLKPGSARFIMSLRSTGEGHISSITFKEGLIDQHFDISFDPASDWQSTGKIESDPESFDSENYRVIFPSQIPLSERVLFPQTQDESMGMEDLRLVRFSDGDNSTYYGTYTAYDGKNIRSKLLQTDQFREFSINTLKGSAIEGKGIAIFPRKIRGQYAAIGRQDGVNMTLMFSNDLLQWDNQQPLQTPKAPFELVQIGNCGSPVETPEGWLLLTHAVGPMRRYVLSATLLDLDDPQK
ncbi:MAG: glycosidase [Saprospiraceae bacterium]|nr:glycosidase [Saprospiraceae bacterium]